MFIGNIITTSKIEDENFKVCRKIETIQEGLPTLIIGWDKTKEIYGDKVSILHKEISDDTFWTFSPKERKVDYDNDLESFFSMCYSKMGEKLHYIYVDLIHDSKKKIKKIIRKIYSLKNPIIYINKNRMVYIYSEGMIFGIDLEIVEYLGIKRDKVITKLRNLSGCRFIDTEIFNKYKGIMTKINNKVRLIPYLYDIENSDE